MNNAETITIDGSVTKANFNNVDITNTGSFAVANNNINYQPVHINFNVNYISQSGSLFLRTDVQNLITDQYNILRDALGNSKLYVKLINRSNSQAIGAEGLEVVRIFVPTNSLCYIYKNISSLKRKFIQLFKNIFCHKNPVEVSILPILVIC